jgi:hypothetical protein
MVWLYAAQASVGGRVEGIPAGEAKVEVEDYPPPSKLVVSPTSLYAIVPSGSPRVLPLYIGNEGVKYDLTFSATAWCYSPIGCWLSISPTHGVVSPTSVFTAEATFSGGTPFGEIESGYIRVDSNSAVDPTSITVFAYILTYESDAQLTVTPTLLTSSLTVGSVETQPLTVSNKSYATIVEWNLAVDPPDTAWLEVDADWGWQWPRSENLVLASINAGQHGPGTYAASLVFESRGQYPGFGFPLPPVQVPVTLTVHRHYYFIPRVSKN